jgi:hypothetical protein
VPASPPLPLHGPQTPCVAPTGAMQLSPGQQSALIVQPPQAGTQLELEQTSGATPASAPASDAAGLGTHGTWLQQSALEAQA